MLLGYVARSSATVVESLMGPRAHMLEEVRVGLRIWPTDVDTYLHVNNGRYLTLLDMGRIAHGLRTRWLRECVRRRWKPLVGAASVQFLRELLPLQRCEVTARLAAWDGKWLFLEQRMVRGEVMHARALVRLVVKAGRDTVPPAEVLAAAGFTGHSPLSPNALPDLMDPDTSRGPGQGQAHARSA